MSFVAIVLIGSCFFIRLIPRIILKDLLVSDTYYHLFIARKIRNNGHRRLDTVDNFVIQNVQTYPYFFHWLLSFLSDQSLLKFERVCGALFDTILAVVVYFTAKYFQNQWDVASLLMLPELVLLFFTVSPVMLRTGDGPRCYNCNPRIFGSILFQLTLLFAFIYLQQGGWGWLLLSLVIGGLIFISVIFGIQSIIFFSLFLAGSYSPVFLFVLGGSFMCAMFFSSGWSLKIIKGIFNHLVFYFDIQKSYLYPGDKGFRNYVWSLVGQVRNALNADIGKIVKWFYLERHWFHLFLTVFPYVVVNMFYLSWYGTNGNVDRFLALVFWFGVFMFVLTKIRPFLFLGSGERYLEYTYAVSIILFVKYSLLHEHWSLLLIYLLYSILSAPILIHLFIQLNRSSSQEGTELRTLFSTIEGKTERIMPLNANHCKLINFYTNHKVLVYPTLRDKQLFPDEEFKFIWRKGLNYPTGDLRAIFQKYGCNYLFARRDQMPRYFESNQNNAMIFSKYFKEAALTDNYGLYYADFDCQHPSQPI